MFKMLAIALNTFREAVRNRILYIILIFALLLLVFSGVLKNFTIADDARIIQNFGMSAINFFGLLISIFIGITLIYNEMEKKTLYTIVSKPIDRGQFLLGKYFGLLLTIYANVLIMALFFLIALNWQKLTESDFIQNAIYTFDQASQQYVQTMSLPVYYLRAAGKSVVLAVATFLNLSTPEYATGLMATTWLTCLELAVITAFACMYSTFSTPTLSAIFTLLTVIIGRLSTDIYYFAQMMAQRKGSYEALDQAEKIWYQTAIGVFYIVPNLTLFNRRASVIYPDHEPMDFMAYTVGYGLCYSAAVLCLAILVFRKRNFK